MAHLQAKSEGMVTEQVPMSAIFKLEDEICKLPQSEVPVKHYFTDGMYAREMFIPANTVLTGAVHKTQHLCVISQGTISVLTNDGVKTLSAPCTFVSEPGIKRVGFAHTDVVWTTFHATRETDLDKLVEELTYSKADELVGGANNKQAQMNRLAERKFEVIK